MKDKKVFALGDPHGGYKALIQCLERSKFDYDEDTLICLGDVCDGWSEVYECMEELYKIRNLIFLKGNHDVWFHEYLRTGIHPTQWEQGAAATAKSYLRQIGKEDLIIKIESGWKAALNPDDVPLTHQKLFKEQIPYYIDDKNRLFIHGGFNRHYSLKEQMEYIYYWDRDLWNSALSYEAMIDDGPNGKNKNKFKIKDKFEEIFIGHTATVSWGTDKPMKAANIWNLDTGGGFRGKLTIMNVDTKEYFQSDLVQDLYHNEKGRNG